MGKRKRKLIISLILSYFVIMFAFVLILGGNIKDNPTARYSMETLFARVDYEKLLFHQKYDATKIKSPFIKKEDLDKMDLSNVDNLMIVAHPDDETLWGGVELMNENYLVLCITNGKLSGNVRYKEMNRVMEKTNDKCIILSYPDAYKRKRINWEKVGVSDYIKSDIETVLTYKKWKKIVTHNPQGEYGHIHHKLTSKFTTELYNKDINKDNLYYFAKYYDKNHIYKVKDQLPQLSQEQVEKKMDLLDIYESQTGAFIKYGQMIKYEKLVKAKDFKNSI